MKIIAFLMAFLVLALSVMPCADEGNAANAGKIKTLIAKSTQHQDNPQQDDCSPFCQCACCAGFSINHFFAAFPLIPVYFKKANGTHLPAATIEINLPIWQPPKLYINNIC